MSDKTREQEAQKEEQAAEMAEGTAIESQRFVADDFDKQLRLLEALKKIMESDDAVLFLEPVERTGEFGRTYHEKIKNPMDLGTIVTRLQSSTRD